MKRMTKQEKALERAQKQVKGKKLTALKELSKEEQAKKKRRKIRRTTRKTQDIITGPQIKKLVPITEEIYLKDIRDHTNEEYPPFIIPAIKKRGVLIGLSGGSATVEYFEIKDPTDLKAEPKTQRHRVDISLTTTVRLLGKRAQSASKNKKTTRKKTTRKYTKESNR